VVVDHLRRAIRLGRYLPGESLPPERELSQQLAVSRTTLREAARVLEGEGMIETKRGRNGGMKVVAIDASPAESRQLLRAKRKEIETVIEFRIAVESETALLAARRRTKRDLQKLDALFEELGELTALSRKHPEADSPYRWSAVDTGFHMAIAGAAGNELLAKAVADTRAAMFEPLGLIFSHIDPAANDLHEEILEAIRSKDEAGARRTMTAHIEATKESLATYLNRGAH
jgi:DNA-binding FadR family transcriptional regulator